MKFGYLGHSSLLHTQGKALLNLQPNLLRDPVAFDAPLLQPLRFREAISTLHDVVISDLKFRKRDKTAYLEWKKAEAERIAALRRTESQRVRQEVLAKHANVPPDLQKRYNAALKDYWKKRSAYANWLYYHDQQAWRMLMPCDPVITVAPDVVFFECFSKDESTYGCLTVDREGGFGKADAKHGTTNVDYSWDLYHHFQALRSYRETRFRVDPQGFEVATQDAPEYREEKIDLPPSWLAGFLRLQGAMSMPAKKVTLSREAMYSVLAFLKRHRARTSPRAMRFELQPGRPIELVLEPWEQRIVCHGSVYDGPPTDAVRVWGKQRLLTLARLLPLADRFDVHLTGTGLPSFWVARMGEMRFTLGLSGWTTNDWTRASAMDLLAPPGQATRALFDRVGELVRAKQRASLPELEREAGAKPADVRTALDQLASAGQVIHDLTDSVYRWRQVMPVALGEAQAPEPHPEVVGARELMFQSKVRLKARLEAPGGAQIYQGTAGNQDVELLVDGDGRIRRGKCGCKHHRRAGLRMGPCRHLLSMRLFAWKDGGR